MFAFFKQQRRKHIRAQAFPEEWMTIIRERVLFFERLSSADQRELQGHVQVFLKEKRFEGCGGLELSDDICLTIATQACLLLLHRRTDYYPRLVTILVYPSTYMVKQNQPIAEHIWE